MLVLVGFLFVAGMGMLMAAVLFARSVHVIMASALGVGMVMGVMMAVLMGMAVGMLVAMTLSAVPMGMAVGMAV